MSIFKTVFVGDGGCGKTSSIMTYVAEFPKNYIPTVFDSYCANVMLNKTPVTLSILDTAGQSDYDRLRPIGYPDTDVVVLCFSLNNKISLENIIYKWHPEIMNFLPCTRIVLAGMKSDLKYHDSKSIIDEKHIKKVMKLKNIYVYLECSAFKNEGISDLFTGILKLCINEPKKKYTTQKCVLI